MIDIGKITGRWRSFPTAIAAVLVLLLVAAGIIVLVQGESSYIAQKQREVRVQAEILAASVDAALDFRDEATARKSVEAMRANRQIRLAAVYDAQGALVAGYARDGGPIPRQASEAPSHSKNAAAAEVPVTRSGERLGTVYLASDPQPFSTRVRRYLLIGIIVVLAAVAAAVLGLAQAALGRANRELSGANAELTHQMEERQKAEDQLRQAQKMQALGQLTGGIAHDFNNLLTVIQGSADMLLRPGLKEDRRLRFADAIVQAASRAAALTSQLLAFARRQPLQPEVLDVNALITGMTELLDRALGERVEVETDLANGVCTIEADRAQLVSAVLNIAVNGRDAMPEGGTIRIATQRVDEVAGPMIALCVTDTGGGMDAETLERAMEPFFTTKPAGKGTGLGLSQVFGFIRQSGGAVGIDTEPGQGTTVRLYLPADAGTAPAPRAEAPIAVPMGARSGETVLVVEDEERVRNYSIEALRELGYEVIGARDGPEALRLIEAGPPVSLLFSDVVMPEMTGRELAERARARVPGLKVLLTSGYAPETARVAGETILAKPFDLDRLAAAVRAALDA